jgi:septal ring factor EnvC (AmiA/AmiB activator)
MTKRLKTLQGLEKLSLKLTEWVGTPTSIAVHTLMFIGIFGLALFGVSIDSILLILTTVVSLEAIYLAIFIQMTVNRNTQALEGVEEDIEEIQEDVEDIQEDVVEMDKDFDVLHTNVKEIGDDIDEISKDVDEMSEEDEEKVADQVNDDALLKIQNQLQVIMQELQEMKKKQS